MLVGMHQRGTTQTTSAHVLCHGSGTWSGCHCMICYGTIASMNRTNMANDIWILSFVYAVIHMTMFLSYSTIRCCKVLKLVSILVLVGWDLVSKNLVVLIASIQVCETSWTNQKRFRKKLKSKILGQATWHHFDTFCTL